MATKKPILISGIQPSGRLHLGNYLGALKNFVELQNSGKYECYFFIADLHSLTIDYDPGEKPELILKLMADFLAAGLDPKKSTIFLQSQIPAHSELAVILNTITPMGELRRMTQFKEKSESAAENVNVGLFTYPTLMAADILLYSPQFVPVGEDQLQHLELARTLARKFNSKFGKTFIEPKPILTETPRLMSLDDPTKKMSKSRYEGCLFIDDPENAIKTKIKIAVTDSDPKAQIKYDLKNKSAISNLMNIYSVLSGKSFPEVEKIFKNSKYSEFKNELAKLVIYYFADFREKKEKLMKKPKELAALLENGSKTAAKIAEKKINEVKKKIGIKI